MPRFQIKLDPLWRPLLLLGGVSPQRAYIEVNEDAVTFDFGFLFHKIVPREEIESVARRPWPWWAGIGMRSNLRGTIGLIGSYEGVVEVRLGKRYRTWAVLPVDHIAASMENPDALLEALNGGPKTVIARPNAARAKANATKPHRRSARKTTHRKP